MTSSLMPQQVGGSTDSPQIEHISARVTLEWLHDAQIAVFNIRSADRADIDGWFARASEIARSCIEQRKPYLAVHDVLATDLVFTPYVRDTIKESIRGQRASAGMTAVVVPMTLNGLPLRLFLNQVIPIVKNRPIRTFSTRQDAIHWVETALS